MELGVETRDAIARRAAAVPPRGDDGATHQHAIAAAPLFFRLEA
jgi:hypothetical protein